MSVGLLFAGQGTQHAAMLPWLLGEAPAAGALGLVDRSLGADWRRRLADPAWSTRNDVAQTLLTGLGIAAWERLRPLLPPIGVVAGYSVGELAAFAAAGVITPDHALTLAARRAAIMDVCVGDVATGLLAVSNAGDAKIARLGERYALALAIRIGPGRAVLGGPVASIERARADPVCADADCTRLAVALASHTPWLAAAVPRLAAEIDAVPFAAPQVALVCNLGGRSLRGVADLRRALAGQIAATVAWDRCMAAVAERRVDCVLEVGPGNALANLWNLYHPEVPARSLDDFRSAEAAAGWVRRQVAA